MTSPHNSSHSVYFTTREIVNSDGYNNPHLIADNEASSDFGTSFSPTTNEESDAIPERYDDNSCDEIDVSNNTSREKKIAEVDTDTGKHNFFDIGQALENSYGETVQQFEKEINEFFNQLSQYTNELIELDHELDCMNQEVDIGTNECVKMSKMIITNVLELK